ncbi:MAG TPA: choice-of-anchor tandem repeat GloVer-containing protein [Steroidobacteraceae bacterium]|jgi:uncharacterized repeat protein (TIGR03803 family)|nr:choice-of-anchor tandem repeat GloVer-containing protein [Steroidobacteraceae bacterium]
MKRLFAVLGMTCTTLALAAPPVTKLTTLHTFQYTEAFLPIGSLVEGEDGVFYGVTAYGGARGGGTVHKITSAGVLTTLFDFEQSTLAAQGSAPVSGLVRGADGAFYGTTRDGGRDGLSGEGILYRITSAGVLTLMHSFTEADGMKGGELMLASDGNFYGIAEGGGGANGGGTIYRMTPNGTFTVLHNFAGDATEVGGGLSRLVEGPGMVLYGTARTGGYTVPDIEGTFYSLAPNGNFNVLYRFNVGRSRPTGVVFGSDGMLYGSTADGGGFKLTTGGTYTQLHYLLGCSCGTALGGFPSGTLLLRGDGLFYGVTTHGGVDNWGTIYSMSPTGALESVHSFNGTDEGMAPAAALTEGRDGRLYGTTSGFNTGGTVFKLAFLPAAPATLGAAPANVGEVALTWSAVRSANSYNVYRGTASGALNATPVLTGVTGTGVTVTALLGGTSYFFAVAAVNEAGVGPQSLEASAVPTAPPVTMLPVAPKSSGGGKIDGLTLAVLLLCVTIGVLHPARRRRIGLTGRVAQFSR